MVKWSQKCHHDFSEISQIEAKYLKIDIIALIAIGIMYFFFYHKVRTYVVIIDCIMRKKYVISVFMFPLELSFTKATIFIFASCIKTCQQK